MKNALFVLGLLAVVVVAAIGLPFDSFGLASGVSEAYVSYGNLGQVLFTADQDVYIYDAPGDTATTVALPVDADGNGFDSYVVWECQYVGDALWVGLFTGSDVPGWVPFSMVAGINEDYPFDPAVCPSP